jgi:uncharacterized protein (DUF2336 family)
MIEYSEFVRLSRSSDSEERGHAAHLAALAYLDHRGSADEHAALYASLISFLDDSSVKVRASLAYGLLHSEEAPRPIIMALLQDSRIISRAILQYSPILIDVDLLSCLRKGDASEWFAVAQRKTVSARIAAALIACGDDSITLHVLRRSDVDIGADLLTNLANERGSDPKLRGALLGRADLPASARLILVRHVTEALRNTRLVRGSLHADRLNRLLQDGADTAVSAIGEVAAGREQGGFVSDLVVTSQVNARLLLHALVTGHVMFFSSCMSELAGVSRQKVFTLLETGSRASIAALFQRAGIEVELAKLLVRLVLHARTADLSDDVSARHYVVTALTEELIALHDGAIPAELEEAFGYLSEQNIALARKAARGVMQAFGETSRRLMALPENAPEPLALPAA